MSLEFVFSDIRLTVGEDLLPLSVQESPNLCMFKVLFFDLFQQRVAPFYRTLTTTTDQQTGLLAGSDRLVLGMR